jgi:hypothetical protein
MNQFQRDLDAHITREQPGSDLDDLDTATEAFLDCVYRRLSTPEETFMECLICGDVDSHEQDCPVPALEKWSTR